MATDNAAVPNAPAGTAERVIQRLEDANAGGFFHCEADREEAIEIVAEEISAAKAAVWCHEMAKAPQDQRIIVWLPAKGCGEPRAAYAIWNRDQHALRPRPFWDIEGMGRVTAMRENQPVAWRYDVDGPVGLEEIER